MTPEYRQRLGPKHQLGPFEWGHKLGEVAKPNSTVVIEEPTGGEWSLWGEIAPDGTVKLKFFDESTGLHELGEFKGRDIHKTPLGEVLRCVSE